MTAIGLDELKHCFGAAELLELAKNEGLHHRGSGRNRCECPGCRNGDPRGASIGEQNGVGLWCCFRDAKHRGTAIDFLMHSRGLCLAEARDELSRSAGRWVAQPRPLRTPAPAYPPAADVFALWNRCLPLRDDPEIAAAWSERGIDVAEVESRDLARVLPRGAAVPPWAWGLGAPWSAGPYRLIVPLFDQAGRLVSLHARVAQGPKGKKALSPRGCALSGSIMADALGRRLLAGHQDAVEAVKRGGVLIAEGVPDFLTWSTHWGDAAEGAPAVLSVIAGSWTPEIAARIPDGERVGVATHEDQAGEKYAHQIASTLAARCKVVRIRIPLQASA